MGCTECPLVEEYISIHNCIQSIKEIEEEVEQEKQLVVRRVEADVTGENRNQLKDKTKFNTECMKTRRGKHGRARHTEWLASELHKASYHESK